jgi:hypothetical protein
MYVYCNTGARSRNHCCRGKAVNIKYYECVCVCVSVTFVIQHAKRMCNIVSSVACLPTSLFLKLGTAEGCRGVSERRKCVMVALNLYARIKIVWRHSTPIIQSPRARNQPLVQFRSILILQPSNSSQ